MRSRTTEAARAYARAGIFVTPIPPGRKVPTRAAWQHDRFAEADIDHVFNGSPQNVGALLGASGLVDIDHDTPEAGALSPLVLPPTRTFGRRSNPRSHGIYRVDERKPTKRFQIREADAVITLVEYRDSTREGTSVQTVFPPSTHPSGEVVEWDGGEGKAFASVEASELTRRVRHLAGLAVLLRYYPRASGGRHVAAGALASVLARSAVAGNTLELVRAFAEFTGDEEVEDRVQYARDTVQAIQRGNATTGAPTLVEILGSTEQRATNTRTALEWIEFDGRVVATNEATEDSDVCTSSVLDIRTGAEWMEAASELAQPRPLWGSLWFEGETTILFSETNAGKSVAAVQLADAIARGGDAFGLVCESEPQDVLYLDFELSAKQFERRYSSDFEDPYRFAPGLHRAELDPDALADEEAFDVAVRTAIERAVDEHGYRVVVVDNLTFLGRQSQEARDALPLMRALHRLKRKHALSMLILGHTPKRDGSRPLTLNDLGGSRHLANFADAVVGLGKSAREPNVRYLKQLKVRSAEMEYHADNVLVLSLEKPSNFLGFRLIDYGPESAHLRDKTDAERGQRDADILDLHSEGRSYREIAAQLGISKTTVQKVVRAAQTVPDPSPVRVAGTAMRYGSNSLGVPGPQGGQQAGTAHGDGATLEPDNPWDAEAPF